MAKRLEQDQVYKKDDLYYKILTWEQRAIEYRVMMEPKSKEGEVFYVSKKEFCNLIKEAELIHSNP